MSKPGQSISKAEFEKMRKRWKDKNPKKTQSVEFSLESIKRVLDSPKAAGIRVYFGENDEGADTVMLVPTTEDGKSNLSFIEDRGLLCPPNCPDEIGG